MAISLVLSPDDEDFIKTAAELPQDWAEGAYKTWINALKATA